MSNVDKIIQMFLDSEKEFIEKQKKRNLPKAKYKYKDVVKFQYGDIEKVGEVYIIDKYGTWEQHEEPSYDIYIKEENMLYKHIRQKYVVELVKAGEDSGEDTGEDKE